MDFGSGIISVFTVHFYESWQHPATHQLKSLSSKLTVVIFQLRERTAPVEVFYGRRVRHQFLSIHPKVFNFFFLLFHNPSVFDDQIKLNTACPIAHFLIFSKFCILFEYTSPMFWISLFRIYCWTQMNWILQVVI